MGNFKHVMGLIGIGTGMTALGIYMFGAGAFGVNPTNWGKVYAEYGQRQLEYEAKIEDTSSLLTEAMKKAQMVDGKVGMSFSDQAEFVNELGYEKILQEGEYLDFRMHTTGISMRVIGPYHLNNWFEVSEEKLKEYIKEE